MSTRGMQQVRRLAASEYFVLLLTGVVMAAMAPAVPGLFSPGNLGNIVANLLPLLVVSTGQTIVLIAGGIDLSVTATISLTSLAGALVMNGSSGLLRGHPAAVPVALALMLCIGAAVGLFNGLSVTKLRMPAFMVTLTSMMFVGGFAVWLSKSKAFHDLPPAFAALGNQLWLTLLVSLLLCGLAHLMLSRSLFGAWIYAVGQNTRTAHVCGVPVDRVVISAYVASGVFAAAAGILYTARLETGSPVMGQRILLDVIAATVIGGTSLFGGRGKIPWTFFGALFLTVLDNALNLRGLSHFSIAMIKGAVILGAAFLDAARVRRA